MWMLRLLPGMGPETKKPEPEPRPGVQKIKLVPRAALPPQNANSKAIVAEYREQIAALYAMTQGRLEALHVMFCQIAEHNGKPPLPPATMLALLELTPEDCKEQPVIVSEVSLEKAFEKMVKPDDNAQNFRDKVVVVIELQIKRSRHAETEIEKLRAPFKELHTVCNGSANALYLFFMELLPEEQRAQSPMPMWLGQVMRMPPGTKTIPLDHFCNMFQGAMDYTDTAEEIIPKVQKHILLNKDPKAAKEAAAAAEAAQKEAMAKAKEAAAAGPKGPAPPKPEAIAIVDNFKSEIKAMHAATGGRVTLVHSAFCAICQANGRPSIPPPAMGMLLELTKEDTQKQPVCASEEQLFKALYKMPKPDDTPEIFGEKVMSHIVAFTGRCKHAKEQIEVLRPALNALHAGCGGATKDLHAFFMDLMPEEQRAAMPLDMWNMHVMRVHPKTEQIALEQFILSFQDSMDTEDDSTKILPILEKHTAALTASTAPKAGTTEGADEGKGTDEDVKEGVVEATEESSGKVKVDENGEGADTAADGGQGS